MSIVLGKLYTAPWAIKRPGFFIPDGSLLLLLGFEPVVLYNSDDTGETYSHSTGYFTITALTSDGVEVMFDVSDSAVAFFKPAT
jgi:hypothetical protein